MNSCILMVEIYQEPQLRHTPDGMELTEMMLQFPGLRPDDPPAMLRAIAWGNLANEVYQNYHQGDRVLVEGRLNMNTFDRPEGFKEKRAELTLQRIHSLGAGFNPSSSPMVETTPMATNMRTAPPVVSPQAAPNYDSPRPAATPATSNVGVLPQNDFNDERDRFPQSTPQAAPQSAPQPVPQSTNYERKAYPVVTQEESDMDDIPF
jgi:single-strand DNA-binding protein